jgi:hypothetical protein
MPSSHIYFFLIFSNMGQHPNMPHPQQQQQQHMHQLPKTPQVMTVRTVEDLERDLRAKSQPQPNVHRAVRLLHNYVLTSL